MMLNLNLTEVTILDNVRKNRKLEEYVSVDSIMVIRNGKDGCRLWRTGVGRMMTL